MSRRKAVEPPPEPRINDHTLVEVVARYLGELDNPAPDPTMRHIYRKWMGEFVELHKQQEGGT